MEANEFIDVMLRDLHGGLRADIEPLTQEQLVHQPAASANTVAFLLWHATRFEDNMLHRQNGEDSLWTAEEDVPTVVELRRRSTSQATCLL